MTRWLSTLFAHALLSLLCGLAAAQTPLAPADAEQVEEKMATWLAHPAEFGVRPKRVKHFATVSAKLSGRSPPTDVHIVEYEMPDGTYGRGLANPVTWSFVGPIPYDALGNEGLVTAYTGWLWLFPAISDGRAETRFEPTTLAALQAKLKQDGMTDVKVQAQYRVGTSEFFEFEGRREGVPMKGAGSAGSMLVLDASAPQASLPVVYTYLAGILRGAR